MSWKLSEIWKEHTYPRGKNKGQTHRAIPEWSEERKGYDTYPSDKNGLEDAKLALSLDELYDHLEQGRRVRCAVPSTGDSPILSGGFCAVFKQE